MSSNEPSSRIAVLAGASGLVGSQCLLLLLQSGCYGRVIALVRRPLELEHPKLTQVQVSFENIPLLSEFAGADVFCALGTTMKQAGSRQGFRKVDYDAVLAFASVASQGGAQQFVLISSIGADAQSSTFYLQVKGEIEGALRALPFTSLHIFHPSFLAGDRTTSRTAERVGTAVAKTLDFAFVGIFKKYSPVEASDLAVAMLAAACRAEPGVHIYEYEQILALAKA